VACKAFSALTMWFPSSSLSVKGHTLLLSMRWCTRWR